jgi:hypothetical protein
VVNAAITVVPQERIAGTKWKKGERWGFGAVGQWEEAIHDFERGTVSANGNELTIAFTPGIASNFYGLVGSRGFTHVDFES